MHSSSAFAFWDHNVFPWLYGLTTKQGGHLRIDLLCKAGIQSLLSCRDLSSAEISSWTEVLMKRETTESLRGSLGQAEERLVCRFRAGSLRAYRVLSHNMILTLGPTVGLAIYFWNLRLTCFKTNSCGQYLISVQCSEASKGVKWFNSATVEK